MTEQQPLSKEDKAAMQALHENLHVALNHFFTEMQGYAAELMRFDTNGPSAYVVTVFNHAVDDQYLNELQLGNRPERSIALTAGAVASMPYVLAEERPENKAKTVEAMLRHGPQTLAASAFLGTMHSSGILETVMGKVTDMLRRRWSMQ